MANTIEQFGAELKRKMASIDYSPIFRAISDVVKRSIAQNFASGGRFGTSDLFGGGSSKWKPSKRTEGKKGGQTLQRTSMLKQSMNVIVRQEGSKIIIEAGSNLKYAKVHQFGFNGSVNVPSHSRTSKKGETYSVKGFSRQMIIDRRPFVVLQSEDIEEIKMLIAKHMIKVTGSW